MNVLWVLFFIIHFFASYNDHVFLHIIEQVKYLYVVCMYAQLLRCVWLFVIPCIGAYQASLAIEFSRQEY